MKRLGLRRWRLQVILAGPGGPLSARHSRLLGAGVVIAVCLALALGARSDK